MKHAPRGRGRSSELPVLRTALCLRTRRQGTLPRPAALSRGSRIRQQPELRVAPQQRCEQPHEKDWKAGFADIEYKPLD